MDTQRKVKYVDISKLSWKQAEKFIRELKKKLKQADPTHNYVVEM